MQRAGTALKNTRSLFNIPGSVLHLAYLPRNVVPRDLRRMAEKAGVRGTYESTDQALIPFADFLLTSSSYLLVHLDYRNYRPDGRAYFVFSSRVEATNAAVKLDGVLLSGNSAHAFVPYKSHLPLASRGNGPSAGLKERGRTVHIEGLPDMRPDELAEALTRERFSIEDTAESPGVMKTIS